MSLKMYHVESEHSNLGPISNFKSFRACELTVSKMKDLKAARKLFDPYKQKNVYVYLDTVLLRCIWSVRINLKPKREQG